MVSMQLKQRPSRTSQPSAKDFRQCDGFIKFGEASKATPSQSQSKQKVLINIASETGGGETQGSVECHVDGVPVVVCGSIFHAYWLLGMMNATYCNRSATLEQPHPREQLLINIWHETDDKKLGCTINHVVNGRSSALRTSLAFGLRLMDTGRASKPRPN